MHRQVLKGLSHQIRFARVVWLNRPNWEHEMRDCSYATHTKTSLIHLVLGNLLVLTLASLWFSLASPKVVGTVVVDVIENWLMQLFVITTRLDFSHSPVKIENVTLAIFILHLRVSPSTFGNWERQQIQLIRSKEKLDNIFSLVGDFWKVASVNYMLAHVSNSQFSKRDELVRI